MSYQTYLDNLPKPQHPMCRCCLIEDVEVSTLTINEVRALRGREPWYGWLSYRQRLNNGDCEE